MVFGSQPEPTHYRPTMLRLAVLGDPIDHSLSPRIHAAAMAALRIEGTYEARRVDADGMRSAVEDVRGGRLDGANVTMPHKRLAAELCEDLTDLARRAGSVNTLMRCPGGVCGESTDVTGIRDAWDGLPTEPVLVLGAGGAAAAALLAFEDRPVYISARREEAAAGLLDRLEVEGTVIPWGDPLSGGVVVNATPIGMGGESLPSTVLDSAAGLFDMPYGPESTPAVEALTARGLPVVAGAEMLLFQAVASFRLWTGREPPLAAMRRAIG